jgi:hypothetical protein
VTNGLKIDPLIVVEEGVRWVRWVVCGEVARRNDTPSTKLAAFIGGFSQKCRAIAVLVVVVWLVATH